MKKLLSNMFIQSPLTVPDIVLANTAETKHSTLIPLDHNVISIWFIIINFDHNSVMLLMFRGTNNHSVNKNTSSGSSNTLLKCTPFCSFS